MPADELAALSIDERARLWTTIISRADPTQVVLIAELERAAVGFCAAGRAPPDEGPTGEIQSLNVHPNAWGSGAGWALLRAGEAWFGEQGFADAILWVVRENPRARRFYERGGWTADGRSHAASVLGMTVAEVCYRRHLAR